MVARERKEQSAISFPKEKYRVVYAEVMILPLKRPSKNSIKGSRGRYSVKRYLVKQRKVLLTHARQVLNNTFCFEMIPIPMSFGALA